MKLFLVMIMSLLLLACSSSETKDMKSEMKEKKEMVKKEVKEKKEEMKKKVSKAMSTEGKVCTRKGEERSIEVKKLEAGCEVLYTKNGETKSIATAKYDLGYCDTVQNKITDNLEAAGFSCK